MTYEQIHDTLVSLIAEYDSWMEAYYDLAQQIVTSNPDNPEQIGREMLYLQTAYETYEEDAEEWLEDLTDLKGREYESEDDLAKDLEKIGYELLWVGEFQAEVLPHDGRYFDEEDRKVLYLRTDRGKIEVK